MPVTYDAVSSAAGATVSSLTWAHTTTGTNRALIVDVTYYHSAARVVSGVTYAGVALTSIGGITRTGFNMRTEQWKLSAPASGANNVVVTMNGATSEMQCGAISVTGAHQTTASLTGTQATAQGNSATPSVGVTSGGTDELVIDSVVADGPGSFTAGAGQTSRWSLPASIGGAGSTEAGAAGTVTMSWTITSGEWATCGVSVVPAAAAGTIFTRTLSDSVNANDAAARGARMFRQVPLDAVALQDILMRSQQHGRVISEGAISLLDALMRSQQHGRVVADAATATDAAQRTALLFHGLVDSVEVSDASPRTVRMFRQVSDDTVISDDLRRAAQMFRQTNETVTPSDNVLRFAQMFRRIVDDAAVTDLLTVTLTLAGVIIVTRILQDNLNVAETVQRAVRMYRREADAVDVRDGTWYSARVVRTVTEILTVADSVARMLLLTRTVTDQATAADAALRFALLNRLAREDVEARDSLASQITFAVTLIGFVLQSMRTEPVVMALAAASSAHVDARREGNAIAELAAHNAQLSFARAQPILMEMRNL